MEYVILVLGALAVLAAWDGWRRSLERAGRTDERFANVDRAIAAMAEKLGAARDASQEAMELAKRTAQYVEGQKIAARPNAVKFR